jgi:hypothetical protein
LASTLRLNNMDLSLTSSYSTFNNDLRLGFQISLGFGFDPVRGRYRALGPGVASGGGMEVQAFVDANGDGVKEAGEHGQPGIVAEGGRRKITSDARGDMIVTGLGDGASARVRLDLEAVGDPYLSSPPTTLAMIPRPGLIARVPFPLTTTGEVELRAMFQRPGEPAKGLASLSLQLLNNAGAVTAQGHTEYDGTLLLEGLKPGAYSLRIEPGQAQRLHMALHKPVSVRVGGGGGFVGQVTADIVIGSDDVQHAEQPSVPPTNSGEPGAEHTAFASPPPNGGLP